MIDRLKDNRDFILSYLGSVMGECVDVQSGNANWELEVGRYVLTLNPDGTVKAYGDWSGHEERLHQIIGYCSVQNIACSYTP